YLSTFLLTPVWQHDQLGDWRVLYGTTATPSNVIREIRSLTVGPNDTLLVFFAGHGGINANSRIQYFSMTRGFLSQQQVAQEIAAHRPRLGVLVSECCSTYFPGEMPRAQTNTSQATAKTANWQTIRSLFFDLRGTVTVTAASPGQVSYATFFTTA